jgi:precorrin-2 dehydrogenase/sirohydrochlorin ferrochelatase
MAKYPIYLELSGKRVVVIGGGSVAARKAKALLEAGARLVVVAPQISAPVRAVCQDTNAELIEARYAKSYIAQAVLVIAATNDRSLNERIYKDCQQLEALCNVVDVPDLCDFYVPAVVKRGDLQIAIGTDGNCPAYAGHVRKKLEGLFTNEHGEFLGELERMRLKLQRDVADMNNRKVVLGKLVDDESFDFFKQNGPAAWRDRAETLIKHTAAQVREA